MNGTQEIYVLDKRLKLLHAPQGFKTSIDSVLLAASCPAKAGDRILDMGCGVGGAGLSVLVRVDRTYLTGVEVQGAHAELAGRNATVNNLAERCEFIDSDIRDFSRENSFDQVICNPPYLDTGAHLRSPSIEKATAMGHDDQDLSVKDWIDAAHTALKSNGTMSMIHRADKVDRIVQALGKRFGAVEIIPLWPRLGENAKRVIVRAIKHRKSPATLHAGLVLHKEEGGYTAEAEEILRNLQGLLTGEG